MSTAFFLQSVDVQVRDPLVSDYALAQGTEMDGGYNAGSEHSIRTTTLGSATDSLGAASREDSLRDEDSFDTARRNRHTTENQVGVVAMPDAADRPEDQSATADSSAKNPDTFPPAGRREVALASPVKTTGSLEGVSARVVTGDTVTVDPGKVFTAAFLVTNEGVAERRITPSIGLPQGWQLVKAPTALTLAGGARWAPIVAIRTPAETPAGDYRITFRAREDDTQESEALASVVVTVNGVFDVSLTKLEEPSFVATGDDYVVVMMLANEGNMPVTIACEIRGDERGAVRLDSEIVHLQPKAFREIRATVQTGSHIDHSVSSQFNVLATVREHPSTRESLTSIVEVIPIYPRLQAHDDLFNMLLTLKRIGDESGGETQGQIEGSGNIFGGVMDFHVAIPDRKRSLLFARRDEYHATFQAKDFSVTVGDLVHPISPLTTRGELGSGVGATVKAGRFEIDGLAQRLRHAVVDQTRFGGSFGIDVDGHSALSVNMLHRDGLYDGTITTLRALVAPTSGSTLDAECGIDNTATVRNPSCSFSLTGAGPVFSYRSQFLQTSDGYPGSASNVSQGSAGITLRPFEGWTVSGDLQRQTQELIPGTTRSRYYYRAGVGYAGRLSNDTFLARLSFLSNAQKLTGDRTGRNQVEQLLRMTSAYRKHSLVITGSVDLGQTENRTVSSSSSLFAARIQALGAPMRDQNLSASIEYSSGLILGSSTTLQRWSAGFRARLKFGSRTQIDGELRRNLEHSRSRYVFTSYQGHLRHEFPWGHQLQLQVRHSTVGGIIGRKITDYSLAYAVPLSIPIPGTGAARKVSGRVYDAETGRGLEGVRVYLGDRVSLTNANGQFRFLVPASGIGYLQLDQHGIGLNRVALIPLPLAITPGGIQTMRIDIPIAKGARLSGVVTRYGSPDGETLLGRSARLEPLGPVRQVLLEAETNGLTFRTRTDQDGRFLFDNLPPGMFTIRVIQASLPERHEIRSDSMEVVLDPGSQKSVEFKVVPIRRRIRVIPGGELKLRRSPSH